MVTDPFRRSRKTFANHHTPGKKTPRQRALSAADRERLHPHATERRSLFVGGIRVTSPGHESVHAAAAPHVEHHGGWSATRSARLSMVPGKDLEDDEYDAEFLAGLMESYKARRGGPQKRAAPKPHADGLARGPDDLPVSPPASPRGQVDDRQASLSALAARLMAAEDAVAELKADKQGLLAEKRGFLERVRAENLVIAGALGAAKSATAAARRPSAAAAPPAVSLDGAIDAWPLADPGAAAAEGAGDALAELHVDTAETVRAIAAAQAKALALALDAGRNAQAAALAGDNQTKFQWLDTLQSLLDAAEQAAAPPPAEAARPDESEPEDEGDAPPKTYEAPEGAGPDLD